VSLKNIQFIPGIVILILTIFLPATGKYVVSHKAKQSLSGIVSGKGAMRFPSAETPLVMNTKIDYSIQALLSVNIVLQHYIYTA
jgi:hypothetical protein